MTDPLYTIAQQVTDDVMGNGTYAAVNEDNADPGVQQAIADAPPRVEQDVTIDHSDLATVTHAAQEWANNLRHRAQPDPVAANRIDKAIRQVETEAHATRRQR